MTTEQTPQQSAQSITKSMPNSVETLEKLLGVNDIFGGKLTHLSFDCPTNLREAFKQECKQNGSSICKELQNYMTSYIVTSRINRHALGNTLSKITDIPFTIENMNFTQYNQTRSRRRPKQTGELKYCEYARCEEVAVGKIRYKGVELLACEVHYVEAQGRKHYVQYGYLEGDFER